MRTFLLVFLVCCLVAPLAAQQSLIANYDFASDTTTLHDQSAQGLDGVVHGRPSVNPALEKEICILEIAEQAQVDHQGNKQPLSRLLAADIERAAFELLVRFGNLQAYRKINHCREGNQHQKSPIPPPVENIRANQDQEVLQPQAISRPGPSIQGPVGRKNKRQEQDEFKRVEQHIGRDSTNPCIMLRSI